MIQYYYGSENWESQSPISKYSRFRGKGLGFFFFFFLMLTWILWLLYVTLTLYTVTGHCVTGHYFKPGWIHDFKNNYGKLQIWLSFFLMLKLRGWYMRSFLSEESHEQLIHKCSVQKQPLRSEVKCEGTTTSKGIKCNYSQHTALTVLVKKRMAATWKKESPLQSCL